MPTIRQETRRTMVYLFPRGIEDRDVGNDTACCGYPPEGTVAEAAEEDHAALVPGARSDRCRRVAHGLRGTARCIHFLDLIADRKRDEPAIRRPEYKFCILREGQKPRLQ